MSEPLKLAPYEAYVDARARPENPRLIELRAYWQAKCRRDKVPARADIDPADLVAHLPSLFLLNVAGEAGRPEDFTVRLSGTALDDLFGQALTGKHLGEMLGGTMAHLLTGPLAAAAQFRRPMRVFGTLPLIEGQEDRPLEMLLLPLAADGKKVDMILGELLTQRAAARAPSEAPQTAQV